MRNRNSIYRNHLMLLGIVVLVLALAAGVTAVVFAHGDDEEEEAAGGVRIEITMGEMFFQVNGGEKNAPIVLQAGETYELVFENVGTVEHEAMIGRELRAENGVPHGYETYLFDENTEVRIQGAEWHVENYGLTELELEPGETVAVIVTVPENARGEWEIGCFVAGHYQAGMKAPVVVN